MRSEIIGIELKVIRTRAKLSQEALAEKAEVSKNFISSIERGIRTPTIDTLFRICEALDIPTSEFIAKVEQAEKQKPKPIKRKKMI
jgi:transcriptional regulator with XRE-family HTH domain